MQQRDATVGQGPAVTLIVIAVCLFAPIAAIVSTASGHLSIDEGVYHLMARSFADGASLFVWNGYDEFTSPELIFPDGPSLP